MPGALWRLFLSFLKAMISGRIEKEVVDISKIKCVREKTRGEKKIK